MNDHMVSNRAVLQRHIGADCGAVSNEYILPDNAKLANAAAFTDLMARVMHSIQ